MHKETLWLLPAHCNPVMLLPAHWDPKTSTCTLRSCDNSPFRLRPVETPSCILRLHASYLHTSCDALTNHTDAQWDTHLHTGTPWYSYLHTRTLWYSYLHTETFRLRTVHWDRDIPTCTLEPCDTHTGTLRPLGSKLYPETEIFLPEHWDPGTPTSKLGLSNWS